MPPDTSVCHLSFFCNWVDDRDYLKNDLKKSWTDLGVKLIQELNQEITQNVGTKSAFMLKKKKFPITVGSCTQQI